MSKFELIKCTVEPEDSLEIEVAGKGKVNIWVTVEGDSFHVVLAEDGVNQLKNQLDEAMKISGKL
ncbi:hypothetical protein [Bacillus cereus group sp. MYBK35-2]|uniref:hypothetical protein n=1 Tax=unclassified Bacillus cereus group TaxID=2750818 RepID=UPI0029E92915|nr:hypothetical protein [Bacillus cereus]MDA2314655.1 hypothetical protein [Bacillus cereus]MDA2499353.1 hypothetical protein [Bacillus cereus]MDA2732961.1 hypothetical protein [Bacillus cereus]